MLVGHHFQSYLPPNATTPPLPIPMATTAVEPVGDASDMVLLAMLPTDEVMIIQTARSQTIAQLEAYIVDEHARVFPHKAPMTSDVRVQKCVPLPLVLNRRKRTHDQQLKQNAKDQFRFVEVSKTVQVGNAFKNMEQIYVIDNNAKEPVHQPLALPPAQPTEGKKKKNKKAKTGDESSTKPATPTETKKEKQQPKTPEQKPKAVSVAVPKPTDVAPASLAVPAAAAAPATEAVTSVPAPKKRGPKPKAAVEVTAPVAAESSEPPAKKTKVLPSAEKESKKKTASTEKPGTTEAPVAEATADKPKAKRGRKASISAETPASEAVQPAAKAEPKAKKAKQQKDTEAEQTKTPPAKRTKTVETPKVIDSDSEDQPVAESTPKKLVRRTKPAPTLDDATKPAAAGPAAPKPVRMNFQETLAAARARIAAEKGESASTESSTESSPAEEAKPTKASPKSAAAVAEAKDDTPAKPTKEKKRTFQEILAQTRARVEADKKKLGENESDDDDDSSTDSSAAPPVKLVAAEPTPVQIEAHDSTTSSDSDFEDPKPKVVAKLKPVAKPVTKSAKKELSSDDSTDDEGLDYSQSLLADLTKDDPAVEKKSASHFLPSTPATPTPATPPEPAKKPRGRPRKTKVVLPTDDAEVASSQETTLELSQVLLSQKSNPESNSVLVSSLSKNRFSLDNIPVAKLKKTSKNPFAAAAAPAGTEAKPADPPKRGRGRPRKV